MLTKIRVSVARDPLRKLNHNERVMGSIANNLKFDQPIESLLWGQVWAIFMRSRRLT
jgi:hypothetical protein